MDKRVVVLDVETERFGREYAGREGKVLVVRQDPATRVIVEYDVGFDGDPAGVTFKPEEVRFLD